MSKFEKIVVAIELGAVVCVAVGVVNGVTIEVIQNENESND